MGAIDNPAFDGHPVIGSLNNRILLGVESPAQLVPLPGGNIPLLSDAAEVQAVIQTGRSPVVTR